MEYFVSNYVYNVRHVCEKLEYIVLENIGERRPENVSETNRKIINFSSGKSCQNKVVGLSVNQSFCWKFPIRLPRTHNDVVVWGYFRQILFCTR